MKIKNYSLASLILALILFFAKSAKAVCPVCIAAVGTGLGFSRWLGVDDTITSLWIGALLASSSIWTIIWLNKKNWSFKFQKIIIPAAYYLLTLVPLYYYDIIGHPFNVIFGVDKIIFGVITGTIIFMASIWLHNYLKRKNGLKSFFPYQKVVLPITVLLIASFIIYFLLKWMII
ncbi:MAG: hypothetical protein AAB352_02360 [Patescibacteria group bacterium]